MCKVCSSLGQKWGNERAITGSKIILTSPFIGKAESSRNSAAIGVDCRLIVAKIWTDTTLALFQFVESQTLLPYTSSWVEPFALSTLSLH